MIRALRDIQALRRDAVAFFQQQNLESSGHTTIDLALTKVHVIASAPMAHAMLTHKDLIRGERPYGPLGTFAGQGSLHA